MTFRVVAGGPRLLTLHLHGRVARDHTNLLTLYYAALAHLRHFLRLQQILQLGHELLYVFEVQINRSETDIRHFVIAPQPVHDQLADFAGLALPLRRLDDEPFRLIHDLFQPADGYGTLLARPQQAVKHFLPVEFFPATVLLDHHVGNLVDPLVGGKAFAAFQTLATAADGIGFLALARVHHFVIFKATERALHVRRGGLPLHCNRHKTRLIPTQVPSSGAMSTLGSVTRFAGSG